jgi:hypothetical protein
MASETVRIHPSSHAKLKELAEQSGDSMTDVLAKAIDAYHRQAFLEGLNRDFAALRSDRQAWRDELAERESWDVTIADGLEDD